MSKQLRTWLFVLLGTLLTSTSLLAEGIITMTTTKPIGETITLDIKANGSVSITGVREPARTYGNSSYTLTSQTVTIRGDVTILKCYGNQLTSLDVSSCTALTELDCAGNQLTNLNVSECVSLTKLNSSRNELTSLDVSGCTSLTKLNLYSNDALTSINLSGCQSLKEFSCTYSKLTNLNVSGCTALAELKCNDNQLTSLDVSGCTALTKLDCGYNQLTSLDLLDCTSLTELNCFNNQLTSLNLSGCSALTKLDCSNNQLTSLDLSGRVALTELNCFNNQLTSLDVSDCISMAKLDCGINQLTTLDLSGRIALTELNCSLNQLTCINLSNCKSLKEFSWTTGKLTNLDVSGCTALTKLDCNGNQLTNLDVSQNTALTELNCSRNQLTSLDVSKNTALTELNCSSNQLTSLDVSKDTALTELNCSSNQLTNLDVSKDTALTELNCSSNQLISLHLSSCRALTKVDCSSNQLTSLDLSDHKDLTTLSCSDNLLRKTDLSNCPNIVSLTCDINQIKEGEMTNLVNSLPDLQGKEVGYFRVFNETSEHEGNVCLSDHVATAKAKNWKTQFKRDYYGDIWYDYTGADKPTFAVTNESTRGGIVAITGASNLNSVVKGTELTVVATPAEGYKLTALTANGVDILTTKRFVVTKATVVKATFELIAYSVKTSKLGKGTLNVSGADNLDAVMPDTELTIEATPAEGYELTALTANDEDILTSKKVVVNEDLTIKAIFTQKTFAVTLSSNEHGKITIVEPVDLKAVPYGTTLTVKATGKNAQCELTALTANGENILATQSFVVKGVTEVKATFVDHTGVETTVTQQVQLYPNPATDHLVVEGVAPASDVTLHSMTGERLYAGRADSRGVLQIDLTPYADGVYLICVAGETYRVVVRR